MSAFWRDGRGFLIIPALVLLAGFVMKLALCHPVFYYRDEIVDRFFRGYYRGNTDRMRVFANDYGFFGGGNFLSAGGFTGLFSILPGRCPKLLIFRYPALWHRVPVVHGKFSKAVGLMSFGSFTGDVKFIVLKCCPSDGLYFLCIWLRDKSKKYLFRGFFKSHRCLIKSLNSWNAWNCGFLFHIQNFCC